VIVIANPTNGGLACPSDELDNCTCCVSEWTSTNCSCDTHTYDRVWRITTPASGESPVDCVAPIPSSYLGLACDPIDPTCLPICLFDAECDDANYCTQDICDTNGGQTQARHCRNPPNSSNCVSTSVCFETFCDPLIGCATQNPKDCDDSNVCTDDTCDAVNGCQHTSSQIARNCSAPTDCNVAICDPYTGCNYGNIICNNTDTSNCTVAGCDPNWNSSDSTLWLCRCGGNKPEGPCYSYAVCGNFGLIIGLTAGAIVALVVCLAFLAFLILSGGTYALATQVRVPEDTSMNTNPLYREKGTRGASPLHTDVA